MYPDELEEIKAALVQWQIARKTANAKFLADSVAGLIREIERLEKEAQDRRDFDNAGWHQDLVRSSYRMR